MHTRHFSTCGKSRLCNADAGPKGLSVGVKSLFLCIFTGFCTKMIECDVQTQDVQICVYTECDVHSTQTR